MGFAFKVLPKGTNLEKWKLRFRLGFKARQDLRSMHCPNKCTKCRHWYGKYQHLRHAEMIDALVARPFYFIKPKIPEVGAERTAPNRPKHAHRSKRQPILVHKGSKTVPMRAARRSVLIGVRSELVSARWREYKHPVRGWVAESELPAADVEAYNKAHLHKEYDAVSKHSPARRAEKLEQKQACNKMHCQRLATAKALCKAVGQDTSDMAHVFLMDPSDMTTPKALLCTGIRPEQLHVPNGHNFAGCCGKGIRNVYDCMLRDLPKHMRGNLVVLSLFADLCGSWSDGTREELLQWWRNANKAKFFAFSFTISQLRERNAKEYQWKQEVLPWMSQMARETGYRCHDTENTYKAHDYKVGKDMKMYFYSCVFRKATVPVPVPRRVIHMDADDAKLYARVTRWALVGNH
jgi:hypothetical protein